MTTGGTNFFPNVAAASRAIPNTPKQSTRFDVISYSNTTSCSPRSPIASEPTAALAYSGLSLKIYMPSGSASGYILELEPSSSIEHIIPYDSTPRSLPFLILKPSSDWPSLCELATCPPSRTTGTFCPSFTFGAPVTICTSVPSSSICTWHTTSLSASGCFSILLILPTIILSRFLSNSLYPSTFVPDKVIASVYSCALHERSGTYAFIHDNDVSIFIPHLS